MPLRYQIEWVTEKIAVGGSPLSYDDLDQIREQGIDAIINLCAEFCDLHDIEKNEGFEVYYLPCHDEGVPDKEPLEMAMKWIDGIMEQKRKLLIHCRLGIGRSGTVLYSYLYSRKLQYTVSKDLLNNLRSRPSSYSQWQLVRQYHGNKRHIFDYWLFRGIVSEYLYRLISWFRRVFDKAWKQD